MSPMRSLLHSTHPPRCSVRIMLHPSVPSPLSSSSFTVAPTVPLRPQTSGLRARTSVASDVKIRSRRRMRRLCLREKRRENECSSPCALLSRAVLDLLLILAILACVDHVASFSLALRRYQRACFCRYPSPLRAVFPNALASFAILLLARCLFPALPS